MVTCQTQSAPSGGRSFWIWPSGALRSNAGRRSHRRPKQLIRITTFNGSSWRRGVDLLEWLADLERSDIMLLQELRLTEGALAQAISTARKLGWQMVASESRFERVHNSVDPRAGVTQGVGILVPRSVGMGPPAFGTNVVVEISGLAAGTF